MSAGFTVGDTAPALRGAAMDASTPANLVGATLDLHIRRADQTVITATATVVDGSAGTWTYSWAPTDLTVAGPWVVELQVTYSTGRIQTFGPSGFNVKSQVA